uniref:Gag-Pol polyprotein n=1 Tax=Tanacetum cinerariifolium TaxID=118510 RepID=A0A6L2K2S0_TANCI|nr:hypothetical protein [Tanacetum cinerariifolium]
MHNNIMAAGSKDHPPMLATGRYTQWQSRFLRYIDTRPNGDALRKCILEGPYKSTTVIILAVPTTDNSPAVPERTVVESILTMDEIYSAVDACKIAHEMWIAIKRLQQRESLNIQDVKTNLFWEFVKFTSYDGESMESYYTRFYKKMNEMIRNNLTVATMQVNVQFLQQLQPEWSRSLVTTRHKGKDFSKPITPPSESASEEDSDPEQAQRDKDMQKKLALIAKYYKKIYKPTNNNLRTSSNSRNKNVDITLRETVGSRVVQQTEIQCFNCKEFEQANCLEDIDEEIDEQELEAHYSFMHSEQPESTSKTCLVEKDDSNVTSDSPDMCDNDI